MNNIKHTIYLVSMLAVLVCDTAFGYVRIGWDRPIYRADLTVLNQHGPLPQNIEGAKTVELVMTQQDGTPASKGTGFVLLADGQLKQAYLVKSTSTDPCNLVTYTLAPVQEQSNYRMDAVFETVQVVDRSHDTCMDYSKYSWEMEIKTVNLLHEVSSETQFAGSPESVITPQ
jgi:hypothetical protein